MSFLFYGSITHVCEACFHADYIKRPLEALVERRLGCGIRDIKEAWDK